MDNNKQTDQGTTNELDRMGSPLMGLSKDDLENLFPCEEEGNKNG